MKRFILVTTILCLGIVLCSCTHGNNKHIEISTDAFNKTVDSAEEDAEANTTNEENPEILLPSGNYTHVGFGVKPGHKVSAENTKINYPLEVKSSEQLEVAVFMFANGVPQKIILDDEVLSPPYLQAMDEINNEYFSLSTNGYVVEGDSNLYIRVSLINKPTHHPSSETKEGEDMTFGPSNAIQSVGPTEITEGTFSMETIPAGTSEQIKLDDGLKEVFGLQGDSFEYTPATVYLVPKGTNQKAIGPFISKSDLEKGLDLYVLGGNEKGKYRLSMFVNHEPSDSLDFFVYDCQLNTNMLSHIKLPSLAEGGSWTENINVDDLIYFMVAPAEGEMGFPFKSTSLVVSN